MNDWLDKFHDDPREPKKPRDPRWLDKFRDDPQRQRPQQPQRSRGPQEPRDARAPKTPPAPGERPQEMMLFAALMATSLVLGLTATGVAYPRLSQIASPIEILLPDVLVILLIGAFVYLVAGLRQIWAVWLLLAFCVVRFLLYVPTFLHIESVSVRLLTACYFMLQAAAFWFVFTPASRAWLREAKRS